MPYRSRYQETAVHECIIGLFQDFYDKLVTVRQLAEELEDDKRIPYTMEDYLNKRKQTNLFRFDYCPVCGKKVDWNG